LKARYGPYNILRASKKIVKIPSEKSMDIQSNITHDRQSQIQQQRFFAQYKQCVQVKKYLMSPEIKTNMAKQSQSSNTNDS